jgi:hypothetical protein
MQTPDPAIPNIPNTPDVGTQLSFGPAQPVVLFPVRLETRFFPHPAGGSELRIRVYPDTVHIDSHEPGLTADELTWGQPRPPGGNWLTVSIHRAPHGSPMRSSR